jgi:hypothetical protein
LVFSLAVGGAGHGWNSAWPFGLLSLVLFPLAFYRLANAERLRWEGSLFLLVIAGVLDLALFVATRSEGISYFHKVERGAWLWVGLWSLWQLAILRAAAVGLAVARHSAPVNTAGAPGSDA